VILILAGIVACTAFILGVGETSVVAKSYDWHLEHAMVLVNKRGVAKKALTWTPGRRPAEWTSRHASITFNQYGREWPSGGMNDAGLVVEVLWLDETAYAQPDGRPAVSELQWIQMQLDLFATVDEVVAAAERVRIHSEAARVHDFVCDRTGKCLAFEILGGKAVVTEARALTNTIHAEAMARLAATVHDDVPRGTSSVDRFIRASRLAGDSGARVSVPVALRVLASVRQGDTSKWNIVYGQRSFGFRGGPGATPQ
jgi:penicillin V acylase-like amidase (Ntn superfamily)